MKRTSEFPDSSTVTYIMIGSRQPNLMLTKQDVLSPPSARVIQLMFLEKFPLSVPHPDQLPEGRTHNYMATTLSFGEQGLWGIAY